jgi:hypothetical protein
MRGVRLVCLNPMHSPEFARKKNGSAVLLLFSWLATSLSTTLIRA